MNEYEVLMSYEVYCTYKIKAENTREARNKAYSLLGEDETNGEKLKNIIDNVKSVQVMRAEEVDIEMIAKEV